MSDYGNNLRSNWWRIVFHWYGSFLLGILIGTGIELGSASSLLIKLSDTQFWGALFKAPFILIPEYVQKLLHDPTEFGAIFIALNLASLFLITCYHKKLLCRIGDFLTVIIAACLPHILASDALSTGLL